MNLADLRAELTQRANESRPRPSLLPGVQHKVRTTRRNRRLAGSAAVLLALIAVAAGVLPGLTRDSSPEPAQSPTPPADDVAHGVTIPGTYNGARLQKAFIGKPGQRRATFKWAPASNRLTVGLVCSAEKADAATLRVSIEDVPVLDTTCSSTKELSVIGGIREDDGLWTEVSPGREATVVLELVTEDGRAVADSTAVLGVGLYTSPPPKKAQMPTRVPPTSTNDYVVDGFRYLSKVGGRTLVRATIGSPGQNTLAFEFTPSSKHVRVAPFCLGDGTHRVDVRINGVEAPYPHECQLERRELGERAYSAGVPGEGWPGVKVGQSNTVTVRLVDRRGETVTGRARIGVGVYQDGEKQRLVVGDLSIEIDKLVDYGGYNYRLVDVRTAVAVAKKWLTIPTPADTPFVVGYGSAGIGEFGELQLVGLKHHATSGTDVDGFVLTGQWPHPAGVASIRLVQGEPKKGMTYIAIYEPVP